MNRKKVGEAVVRFGFGITMVAAAIVGLAALVGIYGGFHWAAARHPFLWAIVVPMDVMTVAPGLMIVGTKLQDDK